MNEMDFHTMKRKELQTLCKKHKIPANLSNLEMANRLSELFKEEEKPVNGAESDTVSVIKKVKKVRFSPDHELIEFTRSRGPKKRSRRTSIVSSNSDSVELYSENVGSPSRVTRSGGLKNVGTRSEKSNEETKGNVVSLSRGMRLRGKVMVEGVVKASERGRKRTKSDDLSDGKVSVTEDDEKLTEETVDVPRRVTRSRGQKSAEASMNVGNKGKSIMKSNVPDLVSDENAESRPVFRRSSRKRGVVDEEKLDEGLGVNVNNKENARGKVRDDCRIAGGNVAVEPRILLRRSNRKANLVDDSETLIDDAKNNENGEFEGSGVDAERKEGKIEADGKLEVLQNQEPTNVEPRRSRRNTMMPSHEQLGNDELKAKDECRIALRNSVLQVETGAGVSKDEKKVHQLGGVLRRSRHNNLNLKPDSTGKAEGDYEAAKQSSDSCLVDKEIPEGQKITRRSIRNCVKYKSLETSGGLGTEAIMQQNNESAKRKGVPISKEDVEFDDSGELTQSNKKASRIKKGTTAFAISKDADEIKPSSTLKEPNLLETLSQEGSLAISESLSAQLSVPEVAESKSNGPLSSNISAKKINSDMKLTSNAESRGEIEDSSINDNAEKAEMESNDGSVPAQVDESATSRIEDMQKKYADCGNENSNRVVGKVNSSFLEVHVDDSVEEDICITDNNEVGIQVFKLTEDSGSHSTTDTKELPEGSNVAENEGLSETNTPANALIFGDCRDFRTDLEGMEAVEDKYIQVSLDSVNLSGQVKSVSVEGNKDPVDAPCIHEMISPMECHPDDVDPSDASNKTSEKIKEDFALEIEDTCTSEPSEGRDNSTDSMNVSDLKEASSGTTRRRDMEDDYIAEADEEYVHKAVNVDSDFVETDKGGRLQNCKEASDGENEFCLLNLFECEKSAGVTPKDKGLSGEYSIRESDEQEVNTASNKSSENINEDAAIEIEDTCTSEPSERRLNSTDSMNTLELKEATSGKTRNDMEDDYIAEADEAYVHKALDSNFVETDGDNELCLSNLFECEKGAGVAPKDEGFSGEYSIRESDEQELNTASNKSSKKINEDAATEIKDTCTSEPSEEWVNSTDSMNTLDLKEASCGKTRSRDMEDDYIAEADEVYFHKAVDLDFVETDEGGSSRNCKGASDGDNEFCLDNLFDCEKSAGFTPKDKGYSGEYSIRKSDEQEVFHNSPAAVPPNMSTNYSETMISRDFEADTTEEIRNGMCPVLLKNDEGGFIKDHDEESEENMEFTVAYLFDGERSAGMTPQSTAYFHKDSDDNGVFHGSPAACLTNMHSNPTDIKCTGSVATGSEICQITENEDGIADTTEEIEVEAFQINTLIAMKHVDKTVTDGDHEFFIQAVESSNKDTYVAEHPNSPLIGTIASANTVQLEESWSSGSKPTEVPMSIFKNNSGRRVNTSEAVEDCKTDVDGNQLHDSIATIPSDRKCGEEEDNSVEAGIVDEAISEERSRMQSEEKFHVISVTENQFENLLACNKVPNVREEPSHVESSQREQEIELNAHFGVSDNNITSTGPPEAFSPGTEKLNLMTPMSTSVASSGHCSFLEKKQMDGERGSEYEKATIESSMWSKTKQEVSGTGSFVGKEESGLQLLFATPIKFETTCKTDETSGSQRRLENISCEKGFYTMEAKVVFQTTSHDKMDEESENEYEKAINEDLALATTDQEASGIDLSADKEENELQLLFATPIKAEACYKDEEPNDAERKSENTCSSEGVEKVGEAGNELIDNLTSGNSVFPDGKCINDEDIDLVKDVEIMNLSTSEVPPVQASEDKPTANACEQIKETTAISEESIFPLSRIFSDEKASDIDHESAEKIVLSASSLRNMDGIKCRNELPDTNLFENLTYGSGSYVKYENKMEQSIEPAFGQSDIDIQKGSVPENSQDYTAYCDESNILRETLSDAFVEPMNPDDGEMNVVVDKGTLPSPFSEAPNEDDGTTELKDMSSTVDEGDDHPRSKLEIKSEAEVTQSHSDSYASHREGDSFTSNNENWSIFKETVDTLQNADNIVQAAENGPTVLVAESDLFSSLEMHLLTENNDNLEKLEGQSSNFNLEVDPETDGKDIDDNQQVFALELHLQEEDVRLSNDILHLQEKDEILKESDVEDTIKEYMDSESSESAGVEGPGATLPFEVLTNIEKTKNENGALSNSQGDIDGVSNIDDQDYTSVATEHKVQEQEMLLIDQGCANVQMVSQGVNDEERHSSVLRQSWTAKKNARTILIHGTPSKPLTVADMKENAPKNKISQIGDLTTARPAKRRKALQDVQWK